VDSGGLDAPVTIAHVVYLREEIDKAGVLAPNSEALFGKEICNLLVSLEAASPGYGKELACVLSRKASKELIKKDGEVSLGHQKKEEARRKESLCCSLIDGPISGCGVRYVSLLCGIRVPCVVGLW
jgi:hypothetical protein